MYKEERQMALNCLRLFSDCTENSGGRSLQKGKVWILMGSIQGRRLPHFTEEINQ